MPIANRWIQLCRRILLKIALFVPFLAAVVFLGQFIGIETKAASLLALIGWSTIAWRFAVSRVGIVTLFVTALAVIGYFAHRPSNDRDWIAEIARLPSIELEGETITVINLRDFNWRSTTDFEEQWTTVSYDLNTLESVDAIVVPFGEDELLAHTMLSFGFSDGRRLTVSVESRPEKGESYSLMGGAARQLELIYLFGTEPDLLGLRILHRGNRVYSFPLETDADFAKNLLLELCSEANQLLDRPKFYATLRHNCTTTLVRHVNRVRPNSIGLSTSVLFPGKIGELLHSLNYIDTSLDWPSTKERFRVDDNIGPKTERSRFSDVLRK